MLKRVISGAALVVIFAAGLLEGKYLLLALLLIASLCGERELLQVTGSANAGLDTKRWDIMALCTYAVTLCYYAAAYAGADYKWLLAILIFGMLFMMLIYVMKYPVYHPLDLMSAFFSVVYIGVMLSMIYLLRQENDGIYYVWFIFIGSWVCDTCAYFAGSLLGRHKMAPVLSPKKTIEGAVGGVLGSILVALIYGLILSHIKNISMAQVAFYCLIAFVTSIFSQVGDLTASAVKRHFDVKDYGALIPGHGGILDRFDSCIVTAPLIYILVSLVRF